MTRPKRWQAILRTDCPKCGAAAGDSCTPMGSNRRLRAFDRMESFHAERYWAEKGYRIVRTKVPA